MFMFYHEELMMIFFKTSLLKHFHNCYQNMQGGKSWLEEKGKESFSVWNAFSTTTSFTCIVIDLMSGTKSVPLTKSHYNIYKTQERLPPTLMIGKENSPSGSFSMAFSGSGESPL